MDKKFKISKKGKYIQVEYIGYTPPNEVIRNHTHGYLWMLNVSDARKFIKLVLDLEVEINKQYGENNRHNPNKIIRFYLNVIDGVSSGCDIRSKLTLPEFATLIMNGFNNAYDRANSESIDILKGIIDTPVSRYSHSVDRYEHLQLLYELDVEPLEAYLKKDELITMSETLDKIMALVTKVKDGI